MHDNYKGFEIYWSDNQDMWACHAIEYTSPSLVRMKSKIDGLAREARKKSAVPCFVISYHGAAPVRASIVEYMGKRPYGGERVAVISEGKTRSQEQLESLMQDTTQALAAYKVFADMQIAADELARKATKLFKELPRIEIDDIAALVQLKGQPDES